MIKDKKYYTDWEIAKPGRYFVLTGNIDESSYLDFKDVIERAMSMIFLRESWYNPFTLKYEVWIKSQADDDISVKNQARIMTRYSLAGSIPLRWLADKTISLDYYELRDN